MVTSARRNFKCREGSGEYLTNLGVSLGLPTLDSRFSVGTSLTSSARRRVNLECVDYVQWPATVVTVVSTSFIGSQKPAYAISLLEFITSNALWVIWGLHTDVYARIILECIHLGMNARGFKKNFAGHRQYGHCPFSFPFVFFLHPESS